MTFEEKLIKVAENTSKVYESGKQAEWSEFWDAFQDYGNRWHYIDGFAGYGWNDQTFKPKYDIKPDWAIVRMFSYSKITDLEARLIECGVTLDTSKNGNYVSMFEGSAVTVLPEIVFSKDATTVGSCFSNCKSLRTIRKITLEEGFDISFGAGGSFNNCSALENVVFEGVITRNITIQWSTKLTKASITSIINALSTTATGQTATFSKTAVNNAFTTDEWNELIATRSNWTISLA